MDPLDQVGNKFLSDATKNVWGKVDKLEKHISQKKNTTSEAAKIVGKFGTTKEQTDEEKLQKSSRAAYLNHFRHYSDSMLLKSAYFGIVCTLVGLASLSTNWSNEGSWINKVPCVFRDPLLPFANLNMVTDRLLTFSVILPAIGICVLTFYHNRKSNRQATDEEWEPIRVRVLTFLYFAKIIVPILIYTVVNFKLPTFVPYDKISDKACGVAVSLIFDPPFIEPGSNLDSSFNFLRNCTIHYFQGEANQMYPEVKGFEEAFINLPNPDTSTTLRASVVNESESCKNVESDAGQFEALNKYFMPSDAIVKFCDAGNKLALSKGIGPDATAEFTMKIISDHIGNVLNGLALSFDALSDDLYTPTRRNSLPTPDLTRNFTDICKSFYNSDTWQDVPEKDKPYMVVEEFKCNKKVWKPSSDPDASVATFETCALPGYDTGGRTVCGTYWESFSNHANYLTWIDDYNWISNPKWRAEQASKFKVIKDMWDCACNNCATEYREAYEMADSTCISLGYSDPECVVQASEAKKVNKNHQDLAAAIKALPTDEQKEAACVFFAQLHDPKTGYPAKFTLSGPAWVEANKRGDTNKLDLRHEIPLVLKAIPIATANLNGFQNIPGNWTMLASVLDKAADAVGRFRNTYPKKKAIFDSDAINPFIFNAAKILQYTRTDLIELLDAASQSLIPNIQELEYLMQKDSGNTAIEVTTESSQLEEYVSKQASYLMQVVGDANNVLVSTLTKAVDDTTDIAHKQINSKLRNIATDLYFGVHGDLKEPYSDILQQGGWVDDCHGQETTLSVNKFTKAQCENTVYKVATQDGLALGNPGLGNPAGFPPKAWGKNCHENFSGREYCSREHGYIFFFTDDEKIQNKSKYDKCHTDFVEKKCVVSWPNSDNGKLALNDPKWDNDYNFVKNVLDTDTAAYNYVQCVCDYCRNELMLYWTLGDHVCLVHYGDCVPDGDCSTCVNQFYSDSTEVDNVDHVCRAKCVWLNDPNTDHNKERTNIGESTQGRCGMYSQSVMGFIADAFEGRHQGIIGVERSTTTSLDSLESQILDDVIKTSDEIYNFIEDSTSRTKNGLNANAKSARSKLDENIEKAEKLFASQISDLIAISELSSFKAVKISAEATVLRMISGLKKVKFVIGTFVGFRVFAKLLPFAQGISQGIVKGVGEFDKVVKTSKALKHHRDLHSLNQFASLLRAVAGAVSALPNVALVIFFYQAYADWYFAFVVIGVEIFTFQKVVKNFLSKKLNIVLKYLSIGFVIIGFILWAIFDETEVFKGVFLDTENIFGSISKVIYMFYFFSNFNCFFRTKFCT